MGTPEIEQLALVVLDCQRVRQWPDHQFDKENTVLLADTVVCLYNLLLDAQNKHIDLEDRIFALETKAQQIEYRRTNEYDVLQLSRQHVIDKLIAAEKRIKELEQSL